MAEVTLAGVRKSYSELEVIHGVDLRIADGEFVVIVGPSGCGKSTLLRMIAGLERISAGEIMIGERVVNEVEPGDRDIAMVFQNYALYPHMSVYDNMAYGLKIRGMSKAEIEARVNVAAETLQLGDYLQRKPRQLSGGQRQRVAMGRAIVRQPSVFLFDEPLSNLDAKLRVQMRIEIKRLHRTFGVTSVYVTHDQVEAMTLADRLVVMNSGVAEHVGTPMEVYERPATTFVAGFIGSPSMNLIECQAVEGGKAVRLPSGETIALPNGGVPDHASGRVTLGIRPEHLSVVQERGPETFQVEVEIAEELGADTLVHGRLGDTPLTARLPGGRHIAAGASVLLDTRAELLHLFDSESGRRL
ncbi:sn-glycerol-3-phosphate import ATP-binding protein UgpC [Oceanibacterium hippocampi]|uniref:sn-glycerol-3-phosphate import ATP-binding protein UgpC n=1 Tax=Oceanibacterium hippocampi TaxID=745714 RepID=A0A1Y5RN49_9PROT|nr:sn-glycerol-3-phosphate import ATP-binding protein UgpC [Oceanibacterium hippocampi]SLN21416.1 sn-glycerol-3-phosphate import ATP-binding protein UgpC [Oceanibacterium hippocampi]